MFQIIEGTEDGKFHVMCKKQGRWPQAGGKYGVKWKNCTKKPTENICENVPVAPDGYVDDFTRTLYVDAGTKIYFKCEKEDHLAGDAKKISYT